MRLPRHRLVLGGSGLILGFLPTLLGLGVEWDEEDAEEGGSPGFASCCAAATSCTLREDEEAGSNCIPSD